MTVHEPNADVIVARQEMTEAEIREILVRLVRIVAMELAEQVYRPQAPNHKER
jgi:hypothetical protein